MSTLAIFVALIFSLWLYPLIAPSFQNEVAIDGHDNLGWSIYRYGTLAYYPSTQPTVLRGPIYPVFIAGILFFDAQHYPQSVQIAQGIIHGFTTLLVFFLTRNLWGRKHAIIASLVCAIHPFILWYCGRVVVETLSTFLFTSIALGFYTLCQRMNIWHSILMGIILAIAALCKETFLPFVVLVPVVLHLVHRSQKGIRFALIICVVANIAITPWTVRNYLLTGKIIPIHVLNGYNFFVGDSFAENYLQSPLGYAKLIDMLQFPTTQDGTVISHHWLQMANARDGANEDHKLVQRSLKRYMNNPLFLLQKIAFNSMMFWSLSSTPRASIITIIMQFPLLILFGFAVVSIMRKQGIISAASVPIWLIIAYFLLHLPIYALARFSVVLIPTMISYTGGYIVHVLSKNRLD
jgi:hypothetical protein